MPRTPHSGSRHPGARAGWAFLSGMPLGNAHGAPAARVHISRALAAHELAWILSTCASSFEPGSWAASHARCASVPMEADLTERPGAPSRLDVAVPSDLTLALASTRVVVAVCRGRLEMSIAKLARVWPETLRQRRSRTGRGITPGKPLHPMEIHHHDSVVL